MRRKYKWLWTSPIIVEKDGVVKEYDNVTLFLEEHKELNRDRVISVLNPKRIDTHSYMGYILQFKDILPNNGFVCPQRSPIYSHKSK